MIVLETMGRWDRIDPFGKFQRHIISEEMTKRFTPECIYNADESGLNFRMLGDRTFYVYSPPLIRPFPASGLFGEGWDTRPEYHTP